jgi:small subunit ribosomal protein S17
MQKHRKLTKQGVVLSNKMDKTIVVLVERQYKHPLYKKIVRSHKKFKAHDETNDCQEGDVVEIVESRPLSREKRWALQRIIERRK